MTITGGTWDPTDRQIYFLATNVSRQQAMGAEYHGYLLMAANELATGRQHLERLLSEGHHILLDSGIFWLTQRHVRAHDDMTMDDALALPPEEIEGFDELFGQYVELVTAYGDQLWGYVELDQGGAVNKRRTRARLHDLGLAPIPVYHPLNDGWDYFDELASDHDRVCFGNIVQADTDTRMRLVTTAYERKRHGYPNLWLHLLGLTPNELMNAVPCDSCDSTSWLNVLRWDGYLEHAMLRAFSKMDPEYKYVLGRQPIDADDPRFTQSDKYALSMSLVGCEFMQVGWRHWRDRLRDEGMEDA